MIYCRTRKFIFVHIPKAAGTTVKLSLLPLLHPRQDLVFIKRTPQTARHLRLQRNTQGLRKHIVGPKLGTVLGEEVLRRSFTFTFVRNPYARTYSCWRFVQRQLDKLPEGPKRDLYRKIAESSFDDIALDLQNWARDFVALRPQVKWTGDPPVLDFVGKTEHMKRDMGFVYTKITGRDMEVQLDRRENVSTRPGEWHGMSRRAANAIADFYARDFESFGYEADFDRAIADGATP